MFSFTHIYIIAPNYALAQLAGAVEYTNCFSAEEWAPTMSVLDLTQTVWWWGSSNASALLGNVEYPFIVLTPWFTLARRGSNW